MSVAGNDPLFKSPFTPAYWKCAARELKNSKMLMLAALFIALDIIVSSFFVPIGDGNLRVYFSFFVKALGAMIYGPVIGLITGFAGDILGFILHPSGPFFPGYTLTAMCSALTYGLFFYRAKIGPVRVVLCKLTVNLAINVAMGSFWSACLFGKGYYYYLAKSVVKNLLLLPLEAVLLFAFFAAMIPILERMNVIPKGQLRLRNKKQPPAKDSVPQM